MKDLYIISHDGFYYDDIITTIEDLDYFINEQYRLELKGKYTIFSSAIDLQEYATYKLEEIKHGYICHLLFKDEDDNTSFELHKAKVFIKD